MNFTMMKLELVTVNVAQGQLSNNGNYVKDVILKNSVYLWGINGYVKNVQLLPKTTPLRRGCRGMSCLYGLLYYYHRSWYMYDDNMQKNSFSREYLEKMKTWLEANKDLLSDYRIRDEEELSW
jgi:hypothetical protein